MDSIEMTAEELKKQKELYEKKLPDGKICDLSKDPLIKELIDAKTSFILVGGAVIDIIEGRKPKDYDFLNIQRGLGSINFKFVCDTATATTYERDGIMIQLLKGNTDKFDFKIAQARISMDYVSYGKYEPNLTIDRDSYLNKTLIPVSYDPDSALNALMRIPHWRKKGFEINDKTYHSLIRAVAGVDKMAVFKSLFSHS